MNKIKPQNDLESKGTNLSNIRRQIKSKPYKMGKNLTRGTSINQVDKRARLEVSLSKKKQQESEHIFIGYRKMRVWKLDIVETLDMEAYEKDLKKKGKARAVLHPNREITHELAIEYTQVIARNNFAMLVEYCGERNLEGDNNLIFINFKR